VSWTAEPPETLAVAVAVDVAGAMPSQSASLGLVLVALGTGSREQGITASWSPRKRITGVRLM
jgi:hypothetical protein